MRSGLTATIRAHRKEVEKVRAEISVCPSCSILWRRPKLTITQTKADQRRRKLKREGKLARMYLVDRETFDASRQIYGNPAPAPATHGTPNSQDASGTVNVVPGSAAAHGVQGAPGQASHLL